MILIYKKTISDVIPESEVDNWYAGDIITIVAGTGSGKSYFIKNTLVDVARKRNSRILMLIHRIRCVDQFKQEVARDGKSNVISIRTYQSLETDPSDKEYVNLLDYDYIVCDEFHYFTSDSPFNQSTETSFRQIINQTHAIKIMMSATAWDISTYIDRCYPNLKTIHYTLPPDFSFIRSLTFFNKESSIELLAENIISDPSGCKGIIFVQKAQRAWDLHKMFKKNSIFCRGGDNDYVDEKAISKMLISEKFDKRLLITTSCLDAGVNIIDPDLTKIVVQMADVTTLLQCIGRKRAQNEDDKIDVYVYNYPNSKLNGLRSFSERKLAQARYFKEFGAVAYNKKYYRNSDKFNYVYEEPQSGTTLERKVNELMYHKTVCDIEEYKRMISLGKYGYSKRVSQFLGRHNSHTNWYDYSVLKEPYDVEDYLRENVNKYLYSRSDREELIRLINTTSGKRQLKSIEAVNVSLRERGIHYVIVKNDVTFNGTRYKNAWKIERKSKY